MQSEVIEAVFRQFQSWIPYPKTELNYNSAFELLIAVILSAQSTDKQVNIVTQRLFQLASSPRQLIELGEEKISDTIKTLGLYRNKAKNIYQAAQILCNQFACIVPEDRSALESLPGVGRKTANVVLNTVFDWPVIAVDTHIFRVSNRTGLAVGHNVKIVEEKLNQSVPEKYKKYAHHWLILHGRYTCMAKKPKCHSCIIQSYCYFFNSLKD